MRPRTQAPSKLITFVFFGLLFFQQVSFAQNQNDDSEKSASEFLREIANLEKENTAGWQAYADISSSFEYQDFDLRKAEIATLSFQPYIYQDDRRNGSWLLGLNIPWKSVDGDSIIYTNGRDITELCAQVRNRINELNAVGTDQDLRRAALLSNRISNICVANQNRTTGLADIGLSISFERILGRTRSNYIALSSDLKWDNGDIKARVSSGTRELWNQLSISKSIGRFYSSISLGHTAIIGGEFEDFYENQFDATARIKNKVNQHIALGASVSWQEAPDEFSDSEVSTSADLQFYLDRHWHFHLQATHYIETSSSINRSYNGSLSYSF